MPGEKHAARAARQSLKAAAAPAAQATPKPRPYTPDEIRLARSVLRAAVHGHAPAWKRDGWKSTYNSEKYAETRHHPRRYLAKDLVDADTQRPHIKGGRPNPAYREIRQFKADVPSARKYSTTVGEAERERQEPSEDAFNEEDDEDVVNDPPPPKFRDEAPANTNVPSPATIGRVKMIPGDWVQTRFWGRSAGSIYLGDDGFTSQMVGRRALIHRDGNALYSVRYDDILFRISGVVDERTANDAMRLLKLSPPEYIENLEEFDGHDTNSENATSLQIVGDEDEKTMWEELGLEFGEPGWKRAFEAKLRCSAVLRNMSMEQEQARRHILVHGARDLPSIMAKLTSPSGFFTTEQAYAALFGTHEGIRPEWKQMLTLAINNHLVQDSEHFVADETDFLVTSRFRLRAQEELDILYKVRGWVRARSEEVTGFQDKCKEIRSVTRAYFANAGEARPTSLSQASIPGLPAFSESDLDIIAFLKNSLKMRRRLQVDPYEAHVSVIVKALDVDDEGNSRVLGLQGELPDAFYARAATIRLLKDIGVLQEWEDLVGHQRDLGLHEWAQQLNQPSSGLITQKKDELDDTRHDFGEQAVYTIDDPEASELDDGISIRAAGKKDSRGRPTYWVDIHIADPTSTMGPNDPLALQARERASTVYFSEMIWPMLPFSVIEREGWSLGGSNKGQRVLTFSARLDEDGNVLEEDIRPGFVKNVSRVTYEAVDDVLQREAGVSVPSPPTGGEGQALVWPSGSAISSQGTQLHQDKDELPPSAAQDLPILYRLSRKLLQKRLDETYVTWASVGSSFKLDPRPLPLQFDTPRAPVFYDGGPRLELQLAGSDAHKQHVRPSQYLVAEFMILAGRIAGRVLRDRNLPAPYRGQDAPVGAPGEVEAILALRDAEGEVNASEVLKRKVLFQPAYFSLKPVGHWPMGITASSGGYVRATSPLRRYSDLVVHWQLKSSLLKRKRPTFSARDVEEMMGALERTTRQRTKTERRSRMFWKLFLVHQKHREVLRDRASDPLAARLLLDDLHVVTLGRTSLDVQNLRRLTVCKIPELGVPATLITNPDVHLDINGGRLPAKISAVALDEYSKLFVTLRE